MSAEGLAELYDALGRKVKTVKGIQAQSAVEIDLSGLPKGWYTLKLYGTQQPVSRSIMLQ